MPLLIIPYPAVSHTTVLSAEYNDNFNAVATMLNSTKLDDTNIQTGGIKTDNLADNSVTTPKIADANVTTPKIANGNVTTPKILDANVTTAKIADGAVTQAKRVALGQQLSSSCGTFTTTSATPVDVTNLSVAITSTGRPVRLELVAAGGGATSYIAAIGTGSGSACNALFRLVRDATNLFEYNLLASEVPAGRNSQVGVPASAFGFVDDSTSAGTSYTYKVQATAGSLSQAALVNAKLMAYEL